MKSFFCPLTRSFSSSKRTKKYAHDFHKKTVGQGQYLRRINRYIDGVNDRTKDYTKPQTTKEIEPLKPIQHPRHIYS